MPFALYSLALAVFVMGTSEFMLAGLVPEIAATFDVSVASAGLLTSAFAVGMIVGAPVMAACARLWPARATLLGCLVAFALCHIAAVTTPSFHVLVGTRVLAAVANAGFLAVALNVGTRIVAPHMKGRALAILLSGTTIATVAGVPAGALLGTALGWRATFWAVALLCVPAAVGILLRIGPRTGAAPESTGGHVTLKSELVQLRTPRLFVAMLLGALINGGTFAVFTFLAPIVTLTAGLNEVWVPLALVLFGVGSFVGVSIAGRHSDLHARVVLGLAAPALLAGWLALAVLARYPVPLLILVFTQGVLAFAVGSTLIARVLYAASEAPTMGGAYATAALNIGAAAGPAVAAAAMSISGNQAPVWVAFGLTAIAVLAMYLLRDLIAPRGGAARRVDR